MAKIIFHSGRELPVSFFGISSMGILYIDCKLPIAEAFTLFSGAENIESFDYITEEETAEHSFEERTAKVTGFKTFVGVQKLYNGLTNGDPSVRITLMRAPESV